MNKYIKLKQEQFGWKLVEKKYFRQEDWTAYYFEHRTGAKYLHIDNDFNDKAIVITLKTCPSDHSGAAHILEHAVLAGSRKYPVRDPFFSMLKNSLQTFMNAFTAEDWTAYLFSSQYDDDLDNLLAVYLDAIYFPKLDRLNFLQEGWRHEYRNGRLSYAGVVYNEMKGAMSSPERLMHEYLKEGLFPRSLYRFNSGGRPDRIPDLSYGDFKKFHEKYYHPANTLIYSFGPINLRKTLGFIDEQAFRGFTRKRIASAVSSEPRWTKPRRLRRFYAAQGGQGEKSQFLSAWLANPVKHPEETLAMELVSDLLVDETGSFLQNALLSSGLGTALADGSGLTTDYQAVVFACGLKGIDKKDIGRARALLDRELARIAQKGFSQEDIRAGFNNLEFGYKEVTNRAYPHGIKCWLNLVAPWRHHSAKALDYVSLSSHFDSLRKKIYKKGFLENKIKKHLINNRHRLDLELHPDGRLATLQRKKETQALKKTLFRLDRDGQEAIIEDMKKLERLQKKKEDLSCLPALPLSRIPRRIKPVARISAGNITVYPLKTSGLIYANIVFSLARLSAKELFLLPLFSYILPRIGTKKKSREEFIRRVKMHTGGIRAFPWAQSARGGRLRAGLFIKGKSLDDQWRAMSGLIRELLAEADFSDEARMFQHLKELEAKMSASIIPEGHYYALSASARGLDPAKYLQENWQGLEQIAFLQGIIRQADKKALAGDLESLGRKLFRSNQVRFGLVCEQKKAGPCSRDLKKMAQDLELTAGLGGPPIVFSAGRFFEGYAAATAASFVGVSAKTIDIYHQDSAALMVAVKFLSRNNIHQLVREKGGAYGGFADYDHFSGLIQFGSYRDPHIRQTIRAFSEAAADLARQGLDPPGLKSAQMMTLTDLGKPLTPAEQGEQAFCRDLTGLSQSARQTLRNRIFRLTAPDIISAVRKYLLPASHQASVCVISSRDRINQANRQAGERKFTLKNG